MPTPSVLPTMAVLPVVVSGKADVTMPPNTGLPAAMSLGSTATSTSLRFASAVEVITTPSEFLIARVKPVNSVDKTGGKVTLIEIFSFLSAAERVGPPLLMPQRTVSAFHDVPARKKLWAESTL